MVGQQDKTVSSAVVDLKLVDTLYCNKEPVLGIKLLYVRTRENDVFVCYCTVPVWCQESRTTSRLKIFEDTVQEKKVVSNIS